MEEKNTIDSNIVGEKIAYIRVSDESQNLDRQVDMMLAEGVKERYIFKEKISGAIKGKDREMYQAMKKVLREGDCLIIASIDRLGRNYSDIVNEWKDLTENYKVDIKVLDMPILDTTRNKDLLGNLITDLIVQLLGYVAQTEREKMKERQRQGIEAARKRGKHLGRPKKFQVDKEFIDAYNEWRKGNTTAAETYRKFNMTKTTFYRLVRLYEHTLE